MLRFQIQKCSKNNELNKKFGFSCFMFEASDPPVFKWYLKQFGASVNLFIDHSQIVDLLHGEQSYGETMIFGRTNFFSTK
jgi:phosphosulfolactate synthase (CoM biosynthesis protein A)